MPFIATLLMGIAGQAAWKLVNHIYERFTAKSTTPGAPGADAPATTNSFQRSLAEATTARATSASGATALAPAKPAASFAPATASGFALTPVAFAGPPSTLTAPSTPAAMRTAIDSYRLVAHLQAP
jgi:hypothetical protein